MSHYIYILLGLSSFWIGAMLPHFFDIVFSPLLCLIIYCRSHTSIIFLYFLITLFLLEQFMLHGTFWFSILIITPILLSNMYLEKVTRISLFVMHIFALCVYLVIEFYAVGLLYDHFFSWNTFLFKLCASLCNLIIFSLFINKTEVQNR